MRPVFSKIWSNYRTTVKIGAQSSYYYGDHSNLQQKSIEPMTVTVNEDADQSFDASPGFGVGGVVVAWLLAAVTRLWRR